MISVKVSKGTNREVIGNLGKHLLGPDRLRDISFHIGNYWDSRRSGLDTETLFREMLRIFKKKKLVKEMMNSSRDEAIQRMVERDVENVLHIWHNKCLKLLARNESYELISQTLTCDDALLKIEEDSECRVIFRDDIFESTVEGRRSIVGKLRNEYIRKYINDQNEPIEESVTRRMKIYNNFTRKTFWRTTGKVRQIVEDITEGRQKPNKKGRKSANNQKSLF
jgi:uncharacterized protein YbjQ (UPF0145 family)